MSQVVNDGTVGGRVCTGRWSPAKVRGTVAPQAAEWMPALEFHVGHGQTSMGLGMVKSSQSVSPELSLPEPEVKMGTAMEALADRVTRTKVNSGGKCGETSQPKVAVRAVNVP